MINRKIVAWARWHYPRVLSEEERKQNGDPDLFDQVIPEGSNMALCEDLFEKLEWAEHTFVDREFGICLFSTFPHFSPSPTPHPRFPISHISSTISTPSSFTHLGEEIGLTRSSPELPNRTSRVPRSWPWQETDECGPGGSGSDRGKLFCGVNACRGGGL